MHNDIVWREKGNTERCEYNLKTTANIRKFPRGRWSFLGPGTEKKRYGTFSDKPDGSWDKIAEQMMVNFSESSHKIFRASSAFDRGELRSKEHGKKSIYFNGSEENIESLLRTVISASQLSVCGAIADLCKELSEDFGAPGKPEAPDHLETMEIPADPSIAGTHTNEQQQGNLVQDCEREIEQVSDDQKLSKQCSDAGLKLVELGHYFFTQCPDMKEYWSSGRISVSRPYSLLGFNRERNWQGDRIDANQGRA